MFQRFTFPVDGTCRTGDFLRLQSSLRVSVLRDGDGLFENDFVALTDGLSDGQAVTVVPVGSQMARIVNRERLKSDAGS